jgi:branched-chain amino acid transport system substrate-binding protein
VAVGVIMRWIRSVCILAALPAAAVDHARADIPIGFSSALTGPYAWVGEPHLAGTELAIAELNAAGGVLGEQLHLIVVDDGCNAEQAPLAAEKLVSEAVAVAFGATCSGAAIPASKIYRRAGILMIEAGATNPRLTEEGDGRIFRIVGRDDRQGVLAGDYLADRWSGKDIAVVHDASAYGQGLAEEVKKRLNQRGVSEALLATYAPGAMDYSALLDRLRAASVDVLYLGGYSPEAGLIVRQARDRNYDLQLVAGDALSTGEFWLIAGPAGEGTLFTSFSDPTRDPRAAEVMSRVQGRIQQPNARALYSYAAVQLWADAVGRAGTADTQAVTEALRVGGFDTILGTVGFDAKGDVTGHEPFAWYVWQDGEYRPLAGAPASD